MSVKTVYRKKSLYEMVNDVCEWYGVDREELKTIGCFVSAYMEGDYLRALFVYEEWKERYYKEEDAVEGAK